MTRYQIRELQGYEFEIVSSNLDSARKKVVNMKGFNGCIFEVFQIGTKTIHTKTGDMKVNTKRLMGEIWFPYSDGTPCIWKSLKGIGHSIDPYDGRISRGH